MSRWNKEQIEAWSARYRRTKRYKRDYGRILLGKPIRAFIALPSTQSERALGKDCYIQNPVVTDLRQSRAQS